MASCADLIRGNSSLQQKFAQCEVFLVPEAPLVSTTPKVNGDSHTSVAGPVRVNVIQGLLDLALSVSKLNSFDVRLSASDCIKAYLHGHVPIRQHFLRRARDGYMSADYEADNILTILLGMGSNGRSGDPYRYWIAAVILFHLIYEDDDAKHLAMNISDGDAAQGEEVVTCIQTLSENLVAGALRDNDDRITIGYLMVLSGWLWEDPDAVNDFLGEGSNIQSLIQLVIQPSPQKVLVAGLCAFLLGIIYEFSTKDSPVTRTTLHEILTYRLGREQFNDKMTKLRENPLVRDYEIMSQGLTFGQVGGLPDVYFDKTFVDFLKDNFSRVFRAMDRDPGIEISVVAKGVQKGISRELVDSLKSQLDDRTQALQKAEAECLTMERKLGQEQADHRKAKEAATIELGRIKSINDSLQKHHEEDIQSAKVASQWTMLETQASHDKFITTLRADAQRIKQEGEAVAAKTRTRQDAETSDFKLTIQSLQATLDKGNQDHAQDLQTAHEEYSTHTQTLDARLERAEERAMEAEARASSARKAAVESETARASVQTELDELLVLLGDLEEKRTTDKVSMEEAAALPVLTSAETPSSAWRNSFGWRRGRRRRRCGGRVSGHAP